MAIDTIKATAILDGAIGTADLADDAVTNAKIATGVSAAKLTGALPAIDGSSLTGVDPADGSITTAKLADDAVTAGKLNVGQIGGRRNIIINGDMAISQRNTSFTNPLNQYTLDRWISQLDTTSARSTVTQESSGGPSGFRNFLRVTVTTADATLDSSDLQNIKQTIEGYNMRHTDQGTSDAETLTCSFWVRSSVTGTYSATLYLNSTGTQYAYPAEYTINSANTWEYKTVTFSPQTTSASWVSSGYTNGEYAQLRFGLMIGSGQGGTADTWNTSNKFGASGQTNLLLPMVATWDLTGVQLEVGSAATPFEHRSYGEELALCQRYFVRGDFHTSGISNFSGSTHYFFIPIQFPVPLRASPTATNYSNIKLYSWSSETNIASGNINSYTHNRSGATTEPVYSTRVSFNATSANAPAPTNGPGTGAVHPMSIFDTSFEAEL